MRLPDWLSGILAQGIISGHAIQSGKAKDEDYGFIIIATIVLVLVILAFVVIVYFALAQQTRVAVSSVSYWQATGVTLSRNSLVFVGYNSGAWTIDSSSYGTVGPEGYSSDIDAQIWNPSECKILQTAPYGALLGQIGNGAIFEIGKNKIFLASDTGELYLSINDNYQCLVDNQGEINVTVVSH